MREAERGSCILQEQEQEIPAESAASPAGLVVGAQGMVLGHGEKGLVGRPVCSSRSGLLGGIELKAWIKQKIRANVWKGRKWTGRMLVCTYVDVGFPGVVPFKCN